MAKPVEDGTSLRQQVLQQVTALKGLWGNKRQLIFQALNLAMIVFSALMIWKSLMVITKSESPVVVVLSGSMEPAFQRGDILFLNNQEENVRVGDIVVFKVADREIPIVHRIIKVRLMLGACAPAAAPGSPSNQAPRCTQAARPNPRPPRRVRCTRRRAARWTY